MSRIDKIYRRCIVTNLFTKGWGDPEDLKKIIVYRKKCGSRHFARQLVPSNYPVYIDKEQEYRNHRLLDGHFFSPVALHLPGIMPEEVEVARFQMLVPKKWKSDLKPVVVHYGGTGDHFFSRRLRLMARPLLEEEGIASLILENPYYGYRKPKEQFRSSLRYVSDLFVMGAGIIMESLVLFHWLERMGYGPLGATGISMGGHMASLAATNWHKPMALVPCLSGSTASLVFTEGVLAKAVSWKILKEQFASVKEYQTEITKILDSPEPDFNEIMLRERTRWIANLNTEKHREEELEPQFIIDGNQQLQSNLQSNLRAYAQYLNYKNISKKVEDLKQKNGKRNEELSQLEKDTILFMKGVMDECTHLKNFPVPMDPELCSVVQAGNDAYYPVDGVILLDDIWNGCKIKTVPRGHISGFVFERQLFRKAIAESFQLLEERYYR